jgi:hypothetical protein
VRRRCGQVPKVAVEQAAVDDNRLDTLGEILHNLAPGRMNAHPAQVIKNGGPGHGKFIENFRGDDAGAMHRVAGRQMLFEHFHIMAIGCQATGRVQSHRSAPDNNHVSPITFHNMTGCNIG